MKKTTTAIAIMLIMLGNISAQDKAGNMVFWENLHEHCGHAYEGTIVEAAANDDFRDKKLVMHVRSCKGNTLKIPFFVGDDKSRTWVLTFNNERITLKHDHRHADGSEDEVTQYGGTSTNTGLENIQVFPADQQTCDLIGYASTNFWWITLNDSTFTYNLRRAGTERFFSVAFDLTKPVDVPDAPWGWED
jgi:hypothetical protein